MYTREEARALVDKVIALGTAAKADTVEVNLTGGERSGTRWANSSITTNLVQYDRQITATVRMGQKQGNATTRDFSDAGLQKMIDEAVARRLRNAPFPTDPAAIRRLFGWLLRQGFDGQKVKEILRERSR